MYFLSRTFILFWIFRFVCLSFNVEAEVEEGNFWAFKPIGHHMVPLVEDETWSTDPIDSFILAKLEAKKIKPAPIADKHTLLRRVYFDLIGLPPSPSQIDEFISDHSANAYLKVVEKLLASRRFGERWGRHWLDVARYADTTGGGRNNPFPNASRYRDYVINSFNQDKPFDRFIMEQIAGDLLPSKSELEYNENLTGTGFLALGPHNYELQDKELLRMEVVDEQLSTVGRAFLGVTMGCARCHDHPFDPIPIQDYYSMAGIFRSTNSLVPGNVASFHERELRDGFRVAREKHDETLTSLQEDLKKALAVIKAAGGEIDRKQRSVDPVSLKGIVIDNTQAILEGEWVSSTHTSGFVGKQYLHDDAKEKGSKSISFQANIPEKGEYEVQVSYSHGKNRSRKVPVTVMHANGEQKVYIDQTKPPSILGVFTSLGIFTFDQRERDVVQITTEGTSRHVIADAIRLVSIKEQKQPNVISLNQSVDSEKELLSKERLKNAESQVRKLKQEMEDLKKNAPPKVQKVMSIREHKNASDSVVHLRGEIRSPGSVVPRGFLVVATPKNRSSFANIPAGASGRLQLAEWVASSDNPLTARVFVNRIWHHLFGQGIVRSTDNFGKMGDRPSHPKLLDYLAQFFIQNKWSVKLLIRKVVLTNTYKMSSSQELKKDSNNELFSRQNRRRLEAEAIRDAILFTTGKISFENSKINENRSLFKKIDRNKIPEIFDVFDYPNPGLVTGKRNTSIVPTQALFMLNNEFVIKHAGLVGEKIQALQNLDIEQKIKLVFLTCIGREPYEEERKLVVEYFKQSTNKKESSIAIDGLVHSLFACLDFRYLN